MKLGGHDSLVVDLVELLLKLRQYGKAQRTLMTALHCDDGTLTISSLMSNVQYFLLLARAHYADQGSVQDTLEKVRLRVRVTLEKVRVRVTMEKVRVRVRVTMEKVRVRVTMEKFRVRVTMEKVGLTKLISPGHLREGLRTMTC